LCFQAFFRLTTISRRPLPSNLPPRAPQAKLLSSFLNSMRPSHPTIPSPLLHTFIVSESPSETFNHQNQTSCSSTIVGYTEAAPSSPPQARISLHRPLART